MSSSARMLASFRESLPSDSEPALETFVGQYDTDRGPHDMETLPDVTP
jgi:hypothetical protein